MRVTEWEQDSAKNPDLKKPKTQYFQGFLAFCIFKKILTLRNICGTMRKNGTGNYLEISNKERK